MSKLSYFGNSPSNLSYSFLACLTKQVQVLDTDFSEPNKKMVSLPQYRLIVSTVPMAQRLKDPPDSHFSTL